LTLPNELGNRRILENPCFVLRHCRNNRSDAAYGGNKNRLREHVSLQLTTPMFITLKHSRRPATTRCVFSVTHWVCPGERAELRAIRAAFTEGDYGAGTTIDPLPTSGLLFGATGQARENSQSTLRSMKTKFDAILRTVGEPEMDIDHSSPSRGHPVGPQGPTRLGASTQCAKVPFRPHCPLD
jgi:hypothetical protein